MRQSNQAKACLDVSGVLIVRGEEMVSLCADVGDPQEHIARQLAFDRQIVLFRVLRFQMRLKFAEVNCVPEIGPIHAAVGTARRIHRARRFRCLLNHSAERIRRLRAVLTKIRQIKERVSDEGASAKGRLRAELLKNELFDRIVEKSESSADAGLVRTTRQFCEPTLCPTRTPGNSDTRSEGPL